MAVAVAVVMSGWVGVGYDTNWRRAASGDGGIQIGGVSMWLRM